MKCEVRDVAAAAAVLFLAFALSGGMILGRAASDLLFYGCALAQAALAIFGARLAVRRGACVLAVLIVGATLLRLAFVLQNFDAVGRCLPLYMGRPRHQCRLQPLPARPGRSCADRPPRSRSVLFDRKRDYAVTIYPPMAEAIFAVVTLFSTRVWAMKLAMVLFEACAVLAMGRLLRRVGRPAGWLVAYLLHPAPIWEIAGNGHVDAAMMAFMFGAFAWGEPNRPYRAATAMTLGALAKPTGAVGLPALWRPFQIVLPLFVLGLAVLLYLPFAGAGMGVVGFLPRYLEEQGLSSGEGVFWLALLGKAELLRPTMIWQSLRVQLALRWSG